MVNDKSMHSLALNHVETGSVFASKVEKKNLKTLSGTAAAVKTLKSKSAPATAAKKEVKIPAGNHN